MELNIINMYPDIINMYGDIGNLKVIKERCAWRNIDTNIINFTKDNSDKLNLNEIDMILIGGGSNNSQQLVAKDLIKERNELEKFIEEEGVILTIGRSYLMFGNDYYNYDKECFSGLEIFDIETQCKENRIKSNIIIKNHIGLEPITIIGFENHSEQIFHEYDTLGTVKYGYGNNESEKEEGLVYKNFIGTNMYGPLLPRNPHLADKLILESLKRKYEINRLEPLNDKLEFQAHEIMVSNY